MKALLVEGMFYRKITQYLPLKHWLSFDLKVDFMAVCWRQRFNHNFSPHHLYKIKLRSSPNSPCDNATFGDVDHILFSYPLYEAGRHSFLNNANSFINLK